MMFLFKRLPFAMTCCSDGFIKFHLSIDRLLYTIYPLKWLVDLSFEMTSSINYEILWVLLGFPH
jgi:hypothetical protein